jgi:tripartite-type tricarboxylate transporter receptor subunit TctC
MLERWNAELVKALNAPEVKAELDKHGLRPAPGSREELARFMTSESKAWGQLVKERRIKAD